MAMHGHHGAVTTRALCAPIYLSIKYLLGAISACPQSCLAGQAGLRAFAQLVVPDS